MSQYNTNANIFSRLNRPIDDINALDVTVVYMSKSNKSKTMIGDILLMGRPKTEHHFGVIVYDIRVTLLVR